MTSILIPFFSLLVPLLGPTLDPSAQPAQPAQPAGGPGGSAYVHQTVVFTDHADDPDGYWLFTPADPVPDTAQVLVFLHGYGGYNPMIYGGWIDHLVKRGHVVIYPRYQKDMWHPRPSQFAPNSAKAIRDALGYLQTTNTVIDTSHFSIVGHSYGGVIGADLTANWTDYGIPKPKSLFLVSPGTGPLKGGRLSSYEGLAEDLKLLVITSTGDRVVGDEFGRLVYETATNTTERNYLVQDRDDHGSPAVSNGHNESYSLNLAYDNGATNWTSKRARRIGHTGAVDYFGYWKLYDALLVYTRTSKQRAYAFGDTPEQRSLGVWADGTAIKPLWVEVPE